MIRQPGPRSVSDRLSEVARRSFVGRDAELSLLRGAVEAPELPFIVAFVHGPGGIGKSWLIGALEASMAPGVFRAARIRAAAIGCSGPMVLSIFFMICSMRRTRSSGASFKPSLRKGSEIGPRVSKSRVASSRSL